MRTTIDIPDALFKKLKKLAVEEETTLRQIVIDSVKARVEGEAKPKRKAKYKWRDLSVGGEGLCPGVDLSDPEHFLKAAYGDRLG